MKNIIILLSLGLFLSLLTSCETEDVEPTGPYLTVYVKGALSNKPRNDVKVTLYTSELNAENETNPVVSNRSNSNGNTYFSALEYRTYWARANTILGTNKTIREVTIISEQNNLTLPVL